MRSFIALFFMLFFSITSNQVFSQNATITIENNESLSLEVIFDLIQSKTDYQFVYAYDLIKDAPNIQVKKGEINVKELLKKGLENIECTYEFKDDHTIVLKRKKTNEDDLNKKPATNSYKLIEATILDAETQQPIVYANIGFIKKRIGTISNEDGFFRLEYNEVKFKKNEVLQISTLGYETLQFPLNELLETLSKSKTIHLKPAPFALKEVLLTNEKRKDLRLGNYRASQEVIGSWQDKQALGGEIATKVDIRKVDTKLLDLKFHVLKNVSDSLKIRVNVYDYAKRYPQKKISTQNIFHTIKKGTSDVSIDLRPYDIRVDDDFIISIELLKVYGEVIDFAVSGEHYGGTSFKRYISQDKWERFDLKGMNFSLLTSTLVKNPSKNETDEDEEFETIETETELKTQGNKEQISQSQITTKPKTKWNKIYGKLTFQNSPISDVNIIISGTNAGTKTDAKGEYTINAKVGDIIQYSHVGFESVDIVVEDITSELSFELIEKNNSLKEAVVTAVKPKSTILSRAERAERPFLTSVGMIDPKTSTFSIGYVEGDELNLATGSGSQAGFALALDGKIAGLKIDWITGNAFIRGRFGTAIWDVDGVVFEEPPKFIDAASIKTVHILKNPGAKYGGLGRNGVIVINTSKPNLAKEINYEKLYNKNYYEDDAVSVNTPENDYKPITIEEREIFGKITSEEFPLEDANIRIVGSANGTSTDKNGNYRLKTQVGDEIEYSYVGMHKVVLIIEDTTSEINIEMLPKKNALDEVIITTKNSKGEVVKRSEKANRKFSTSRGNYDPVRVGYAIGYVDGKEVNQMIYPNLREMLRGKLSGIHIRPSNGKERIFLRGHNSSILQSYPAAFEVDGAFTTEEPIGLDTSQIVSIHLLRSTAATNKYGTLGAGGVIVITTTNGDLSSNNAISGVNQQYTNQDYYQNDAVAVSGSDFDFNEGVLALQEYTNRAFAYKFYKEQLISGISSFEDHIDIARFFLTHFKDKTKAVEILMNQAKLHSKNPEILKAIAYNLQSIEAKRETISVYQKVLSKRPDYAQSYRDLANAYKENEKFKDAWRYYITYLDEGHTSQGEGIGELVYNEMEYLHFNRRNQTQISQQFVPKNKDKIEFRDDVRFVVEWNTSEAEFNLEFVSPDKRSYVFEHTLVANQELITAEKRQGYSSKEFIIDDIEAGEWLMNITYLGNKKSTPTYFKVTTYYNWGKPQQRQEINVYKLNQKKQKLQLQKINKQVLLAEK